MNVLGRLKSKKEVKNASDQKMPELEKYEAVRKDYKIIGIIGKGAFAKVYGAECISKQKKKVAIKVIKLETDDEYEDTSDSKPLQISDIQQEAAIMSSLRHENIVSCYASFVVRDELWLIMPFVSGGSISYILAHSLKDHFKGGIKDEGILCCLLRDTLRGVAYMHNQGRIHRDIKGRNILIHGEIGTAMLADFGVSGALLEGGLKKRGRNTMTGTPCWMAPEVMKHQRYNHKADIWSLGITALELAFGTTPYTKLKSPMKVMMEIMDGKTPTVDSMDKNNGFSRSFKSFIGKCLNKDAVKRQSAQELLNTDFIKKHGKDREYMLQHFVKYIHQIKIKQCHELDMPNSVQEEERTIARARKKSLQNTIAVDEVNGGNKEEEEEDFVFSTTIHMEDLEEEAALAEAAKAMANNNLTVDQATEQAQQKKGKFTVSEVDSPEVANNKPSKFKVTEANDNQQPKQQANVSMADQDTSAAKKKSRFQVSHVDDDK
eukprot:259506_1